MFTSARLQKSSRVLNTESSLFVRSTVFVIIMTPLHRLNEAECTCCVEPGQHVALRDYVAIIREVAEYYSLPVLDLYASSGLQPEIKEIQENFIPDGLHPNDNGNAVIANRLKKFLENL